MIQNLIPFALFVIVMTGTPGPGNLAMMAIGQTTGFRSALGFLFGLVIGTICLNLCVGFGMGELFVRFPAVAGTLRVVGMLYICYLGYKVLSMKLKVPNAPKFFSLAEGIILHPLSPKTWAMSVTAFSQFADPSQPVWQEATIQALGFALGALVFHSLWCAAGAVILQFLKSERTLLAVNTCLVVLMVGATAYAMFT